jgi:phosphoribosylamine-glycine ligase
MADIREDVRRYREQGLSEVDAIKKASKGKGSVQTAPQPSDNEEVEDDLEDVDIPSDRCFVVITKDMSGLGWAKRLQDEGETVYVARDDASEKDPKLREALTRVGQGMVDVYQLEDAFRKYQGDDTYWVFAENCFPEFAAKLRKAGQKIFPPSMELGEKMEHDRQYAMEVAEDAGLATPTTDEFGDIPAALTFLDANSDTAYVFKPDSSEFNYMTFVPVREDAGDANREVYEYLSHLKKNPGSFILQERLPKDDVLEVNVELWFHEGTPLLALLDLELKRKNTGDLGEMAGCAGDIVKIIPIDCELVKQTVGLLTPFYEEQQYTGFADVNVLIDKQGTPHFLEVCNRFGYNAHVSMFLGLAKEGFGTIIADYVDGNVDGMAERFDSQGVAGSLCVFLDHPREGLPLHVDPSVADRFYVFDGMVEDGQTLLTGYSSEIGILVAKGSTVEHVASELGVNLKNEAVSAPDLHWRLDLGERNYSNAPAKRLTELENRGLL